MRQVQAMRYWVQSMEAATGTMGIGHRRQHPQREELMAFTWAVCHACAQQNVGRGACMGAGMHVVCIQGMM